MQPGNDDIRIRVASPDEAQAISKVLLDAFEEYRAAYSDQAFAATTPTSEQVAIRMSEGPIWVALLEDVIIGTVSAVSKNEGLYVRGMAITPEARGKSVGNLLLESVERYARSCGYRHLTLSTTPFLARAIRLYERWGFTRSGEGPHDLYGTPLFTMVKKIAGDKAERTVSLGEL